MAGMVPLSVLDLAPVLVTSQIYDYGARVRSFELLAGADPNFPLP